MRNQKSMDIALIALMTSLIIIFAAVPISIGPVDMAFLPLLAVIIVTQTKGLKLGLIMGAIFGITSFVVAFSMRSVLSPIFQNPLVSIFPRLLIPVVTYFMGKAVEKLFSKLKESNSKLCDSLKYGISGAFGVITNTFFVLGMMMLFYFNQKFGEAVIGWSLILFILGTNFLIELAIVTVLSIPVSLAVNKFLSIKSND